MVEGRGLPVKATSFESCLRRCEACGVAASNTADSNHVTYIHRNPLTNIPAPAREGALAALGVALNERSRPKKKDRFGFSTSEDAVTWVVFSYLMQKGQLRKALENVRLAPQSPNDSDPTLLLWGAPIGSGDRGASVRDRLVAACAALGERPDSFSEPDVIIDLGHDGIVFIEVKYLSGNDRQPASYPGWARYESGGTLAWRFTEVKDSGCYELARNWCLLRHLADGRCGGLANLGPARLFAGDEGARLDRFVTALDAEDGLHFRKLTWSDFLSPFLSDAPGWFALFCRERGLAP